MKGGYVVLTYEFHKEDKKWVGLCEELGTSTFGRSLKEAEDRLDEAVELQLSTLEDVGETRRFFEEHNIIFHRSRPNKDFKICISADESVYTKPHIQPLRELTPA
jgi:predicted RNase H-like HicB family nuclease